jgi:hypothetical protein
MRIAPKIASPMHAIKPTIIPARRLIDKKKEKLSAP